MDIGNNFGQICNDLYAELGPEAYVDLYREANKSGNFVKVFVKAWCDLGDEGWVVDG